MVTGDGVESISDIDKEIEGTNHHHPCPVVDNNSALALCCSKHQ